MLHGTWTCCSQTKGPFYKLNLQIFGGVMTHLRDQVLKGAVDTAECEYSIHPAFIPRHACSFKNAVVINNLFTEILNSENNTIHKHVIIKRFQNVMLLFNLYGLVFSDVYL